MYKADVSELLLHAFYKIRQPPLIRMGRVTANGLYASTDGVLLSIQHHIAVLRTVSLYIPPRGAFGLVAHKEHVVPLVAQHGLEVVDDAPGTAHAAAGDNDGRSGAAGQVVDHFQWLWWRSLFGFSHLPAPNIGV